MREVIVDTETTGLNPSNGDRVVEIGCIELVNHISTGETYHQYINPERLMPEDAFKIHGLSNDFLSTFPTISEIIDEFLNFIGDSPLIIHNAEFDIKFLNAELELLKRPPLNNKAVDTVKLARNKFPGASVSLDALCKRFNVDNSSRSLHGALLDADLLASVYLELIGGKQPDFELSSKELIHKTLGEDQNKRTPRTYRLTEKENKSHREFLKKLTNPIWT